MRLFANDICKEVAISWSISICASHAGDRGRWSCSRTIVASDHKGGFLLHRVMYWLLWMLLLAEGVECELSP